MFSHLSFWILLFSITTEMKIRFRDTREPFVKYLIEIMNRVKATFLFYFRCTHTWQHLVSVSFRWGGKVFIHIIPPLGGGGENSITNIWLNFFFSFFVDHQRSPKKYFLLIVLLLLYNTCLATQLYTISNCLKNSWDGHLCRVIRYHSDTV